MKKVKENESDELRPDYDLKSLKVRKLGPARKTFGNASDLKESDTERILQTIEEDTTDESDLC